MKTELMIRWLKEPLLHFLLLGSMLFAAYTWVNQGRTDEPQVVHISEAQVNWLKETWNRRWSRQPDAQELRGLIAGYLKEALLAREARELGLVHGFGFAAAPYAIGGVAMFWVIQRVSSF